MADDEEDFLSLYMEIRPTVPHGPPFAQGARPVRLPLGEPVAGERPPANGDCRDAIVDLNECDFQLEAVPLGIE